MQNKRRHGETPLGIWQAVGWVRDTVFDLWSLLHPEKNTRPKSVIKWQRPPEGWTKCNTDVAFFTENDNGAIGVILRDYNGCSMAGCVEWQQPLANEAMMVEALACRRGVMLAQQ